MIKIKLENLKELDDICNCLEYCIADDKIKPDNRKPIRKLAEKLRNLYEMGKDIERESAD